jgi:hypothetical protein
MRLVVRREMSDTSSFPSSSDIIDVLKRSPSKPEYASSHSKPGLEVADLVSCLLTPTRFH